MRVLRTYGCQRWLAAIAVAVGLTLAGAVSPVPAFAADSAITGVVQDTSGTPQSGVTVNVLDPATAGQVASTTTAGDGSFSVSVSSGTYSVQFFPPSSYGLQSYLATGVTTGSAALTIILKSAVVVQVQGKVTDSQGNVYPGTGRTSVVTLFSPLNQGSQVRADGSGGYSVSLFADQNFTANASVGTPGDATIMDFYNLPVGTLDHSQTYDLTLPTARLTVSVRDASGNPITGGRLLFDTSTISALPGLPGASADTYTNPSAALDASGNVSFAVPDGVTLSNPRIVLTNGLIVPFNVPVMNGDQSVTVTVPPSVQVQGKVTDSQGNVYPGAGRTSVVTLFSPLNQGSQVRADGSGGYSVSLFADQNFTANASVGTPGDATIMDFYNLPVGTLDHSQTYDLTLPTARLTVSVRDASGNPITGGRLLFDTSTISALPGLPGTSADTYTNPSAALDASGNVSFAVPDGVTLSNPRIVLTNGLIVPFNVPVMNGDQSVTVTVPPSVQVQGKVTDSQGNVYPGAGRTVGGDVVLSAQPGEPGKGRRDGQLLGVAVRRPELHR